MVQEGAGHRGKGSRVSQLDKKVGVRKEARKKLQNAA